ncbi:MAG: prephenate dehydrogenase/arogenate dehydrogenase family protein [Candidatus Peribacteraceae bacterium]
MKISPSHSIGVIGGNGRTGLQFKKLFQAAGFKVQSTGSKTKRKNRDLIRDCDIVIFSVPLVNAAEIIRTELKNARRKDQLLLDLSSLKVREVKAMLRAKGEVIGMHPLFGPTTDSKGETIILCPGRALPETQRSLVTLLRRMGLRTVVMTPKEHDRLMAVVQVIPHLKSLLMAEVLKGLKVDFKKVLATCTPTYELEFNVIGRFLDDHSGLYMPIIFRNPDTRKVLAILRKTIARFEAIASRQDLKTAENRYAACKSFFTPHLKRARDHSEACIHTLISLTR